MTHSIQQILRLSEQELISLMKEAQESSWHTFGKVLKAHYPGEKFPSISVTGNYCAQNCLYCNKHYLKGMKAITQPKNLVEYARKLVCKGGTGMLISGGYDEKSQVPLDDFLDSIAEIKKETSLQINVHAGLVEKEQAKKLYEIGVDVVSFDLITDTDVISEILMNGKKGSDYTRSYKFLVDAGLKVVPHICLGLYYGSEKGNFEALKTALEFNPETIVFLGLIPTKGTGMENASIVKPEILAKAMIYVRMNNPVIEQSLGCMRVRIPQYEEIAIQSGINRIAIPKTRTLQYAKNNFDIEIKRIDSCCAL
ncbi:MAG: radical SAM protein [Candidatus Heimdallarchaeaceae archaeon]